MSSESEGILFNLNHMARIQRLRLLAVVPVLIAAVLNTGYQYLLGRRLTDATNIAGWRDRLVADYIDFSVEPGLFGAMVAGLVHVVPVLVISLLTAGIWERVFASGRNRAFDSGFTYIAILFAMFMHPEVSLFHAAFGMSFGMVFARGIFGGEGRSFLSPALVGVAIVQISFPASLTDHPIWTGISGYAGTSSLLDFYQQGPEVLTWSGIDWWSGFLGNAQGLIGTTSVAAVIVGSLILIYARVASVRLILAHFIGLIFTAMICDTFVSVDFYLPWQWHLVLGSFAFAVVFLGTDPSSSCVTNPGRWIQGIMAGGLVVLLRAVNPSHPDSVVPVLLLVSMLAPLIDHIVIWLNIRHRSLQHGG
ncbi:MAG: RnfABCDGE type electron transport complex subunit D [bacterium]